MNPYPESVLTEKMADDTRYIVVVPDKLNRYRPIVADGVLMPTVSGPASA